MFDLRAKRELHRGFGDGFGRGMELIVAMLLLGAIGLWLDGLLGTRPLLAVTLGTFGVAGVFARLWIGYAHDMRREDEGKPWARRQATAAAGSSSDEAEAATP